MNVLLGISGGIAAYKIVDVASKLRQGGHDVRVAMTSAATKFVGPVTFSAVSGRGVLSEMFPDSRDATLEGQYPHLYPAMESDLFVLAPATANSIGQLANGLADNVVTCAAIAVPPHARRIFCPAMNARMWEQDVVQENAARLRARGWEQLGPAEGHLACGVVGSGRMVEASTILDAILSEPSQHLTGKRVLILSGPTREPIDAVRFLSNHSSGLMGQEIALAAARAGACVDFVSGPVPETSLPTHPQITLHRVQSAADMLAAGQAHFSMADIAIFVAAVADFTITGAATGRKLERSEGLSLALEPTADIAATLSAKKRPGQTCIGFSLEATPDINRATAKRDRKHLDAIVLNTVEAMNASSGTYTWIGQTREEWGALKKRACARAIINQLR